MTRRADFALIPHFQKSSLDWPQVFMKIAQRMTTDCPMPMNEALKMTLSFSSFYYASEAWKLRKAQIEDDATMQVGIMNRLDAVIRQGAR